MFRARTLYPDTLSRPLYNAATLSRGKFTAWTLNLIFGVCACLVLGTLSFFIGDYYDEPKLVLITLIVSSMFLLNGLKNIGVVEFQKQLTFDKEFKLHIIPKFVSFFITIGLAIYFENYWALIIGNVVWKAMEVANSYLMHEYRPSFSFARTKELFDFSKWLMISNFLNI